MRILIEKASNKQVAKLILVLQLIEKLTIIQSLDRFLNTVYNIFITVGTYTPMHLINCLWELNRNVS